MIAIGDIHGCCRTLDGLLEKLNDYSGEQLIFIGDYIDRGPCSKQVIDRLISLSGERDCVFLRGNHEQMLLDSVDRDDQQSLKMWLSNGGDTTLDSYQSNSEGINIPEDHMNFFRETRLYYDTSDYFFVHAGAPSDIDLETSINSGKYTTDFLWSRSHLNEFNPPWEKKVIFGHTPRPEPIRMPHRLGIDTGCVLEGPGFGKLTALLLPDESIIQQETLDLK